MRLNGIVREMDESIRRVNIEQLAGSANVALLVGVHSELLVEKGGQHVASDIKLSAEIEERLDVSLQNDTPSLSSLSYALSLLALLV